ncbi:MAG TPA: peptidylprolyl isomerase, partial [Gemmatimonadales bacterium]|nr:peptidylprolyl isomerase [Gemmatimonadales bacterium]
DQVIDRMVQEALLEQEYKRLGIRVSDAEIIEAARTSPPPQVIQDPQFQTDGQFDSRKWESFLRTADPQVLAQIETIYRDEIPRIKLAQYLTSDIYVSDAKLWRMYRDQHDSVRIASLAVWPYALTDTTPVSDRELSAYISKHKDDPTLNRPSVAYVRFVAVSRVPNAADSAATKARVARVRSELARGVKFDDVARRESADSVSGQRGGDLGWIKRNEPGFDDQFMAAVRALKPGQTSAPVATEFGYHIIRVDQARGDSLKVRHILIPVELQGAHLEEVESRADTLERQAAERTGPYVLDSAAKRLGITVSPSYQVTEGQRFNIGRYVIPDVSVWAFEAPIGETSPVIEGQRGFYVFQLDSVAEGGVPPLEEIRGKVTALVRLERQNALAQRRADSLLAVLKDAPDLQAAATARGLSVERIGPFTRLRPQGYLAGQPVVIGAAFGLRVGERSGVVKGDNGYFIIESQARKLADSTAWLAQRDQQRAQLRQALQQARIQQYLEGVRAKAKITDRRKDLFRAQADAEETAGL